MARHEDGLNIDGKLQTSKHEASFFRFSAQLFQLTKQIFAYLDLNMNQTKLQNTICAHFDQKITKNLP